MSKYFSRAKENKNNENVDINKDGINVNSAKYVIYFLLDFSPSLSMSFLMLFLISTKIKNNSNNKSVMLRINKNCKFLPDNSIKPLSIKVKKV